MLQALQSAFAHRAPLRDEHATAIFCDTETDVHHSNETIPRIHAAHAAAAFGTQMRLQHAVRAATANGRDEGERIGFRQGWRWGAFCGVVAGVIGTLLTLEAITIAVYGL